MDTICERHRPVTWREFLGNDRAVAGLRNAFSQRAFNRFIFHGKTGSGKMALARICAAELGAGGFNFQQFDPKRYRALNFIRKLKQNLAISPLGAKDRIWIFDEAEKLPPAYQQALAEIAEALNAYDFFIFCTSRFGQITEALVSRCVEVQIIPLSGKPLLQLLERVCKRQEWRIDPDVLEALAFRNDKNPRQALMELEARVISEQR